MGNVDGVSGEWRKSGGPINAKESLCVDQSRPLVHKGSFLSICLFNTLL